MYCIRFHTNSKYDFASCIKEKSMFSRFVYSYSIWTYSTKLSIAYYLYVYATEATIVALFRTFTVPMYPHMCIRIEYDCMSNDMGTLWESMHSPCVVFFFSSDDCVLRVYIFWSEQQPLRNIAIKLTNTPHMTYSLWLTIRIFYRIELLVLVLTDDPTEEQQQNYYSW